MDDVVILSLDPPAKVNLGYCISEIQNDSFSIIKHNTYKIKAKKSARKLSEIYDFIVDIIDKENIQLVITEQSMGWGTMYLRKLLNEFSGVMKAASGKTKTEIIEMSPKHYKKVVASNFKAKKPEVEKAVCEFLNDTTIVGSEHEFDAMALAICFYKDNCDV